MNASAHVHIQVAMRLAVAVLAVLAVACGGKTTRDAGCGADEMLRWTHSVE